MKTIYSLFVVLGMVLLSATPGFTQQCGDLDGSGEIAATDALLVLGKAVGQSVPDLVCPISVGVLATEQKGCSAYNGSSIPCDGTGQDGEFQAGVPRSFIDNGDGTITDNATGLMWEKLSDDGTIHDIDDVYVWTDFTVKVTTLNSMAFAGYTDWRVPNIFELVTLVAFDAGYPKIHAEFDTPTGCEPGCTVLTCSCTQPHADGYWSSTNFYLYGSLWAYVVDFKAGLIQLGHHWDGGSFGVRAVRGGL